MENPAAAIKNPKVTQRPTLPFSHEEMIRILAAASEKIRTVRAYAPWVRARQERAERMYSAVN